MSSPSTARFPTFPLVENREAVGRPCSAEGVVRDEVLLTRVQSGDREALSCLFQRHRRVVQAIAARILRDRAEAEDLVQDLFIYLQRKCGIFDSSKSSARSWIVQMTYHRAISRRRYLTSRRFYSQVDADGMRDSMVGVPTDEHDYSAETVFGRNGLAKVFESLSEDQRETLKLYFFEGYTLPEIAVKLRQPHANVRHHYYRGLEKLRKQMFGATVPVVEPHEK